MSALQLHSPSVFFADAAFGSVVDLLLRFFPGDRIQLFLTCMRWGVQRFDIGRSSSTLFQIFPDLDDTADDHTEEDDSSQNGHDDQSCTQYAEGCFRTGLVPTMTGQTGDWIRAEVTLVAAINEAFIAGCKGDQKEQYHFVHNLLYKREAKNVQITRKIYHI